MSNAHKSALLLVTTSFPVEVAGREAAGSFVHDVAVAAAATMPVRVVAPGLVTGIEQAENGLKIYRYKTPDEPLSTLISLNPFKLWKAVQAVLAGARATRLALSDGAVERVIAFWGLPSGLWARIAARKKGIPYDVWALGSDVWTLGQLPILSSLLRLTMRDADRCFADGMALRTEAERIAGRSVSFLPSIRKIEAFSEGASAKILSRDLRPKDKKKLVFVGRWHPNKGIDILLKSLGCLSENDWAEIERVEIYGGGELHPQVNELAAVLQSSGRPVAVYGYLTKLEFVDVVMRADFLLIPSRIESIPLVFSDAMQLGCPVIAMPVGDLPELIESEGVSCGTLSTAIDAESFAQAISRALRLPYGQFIEGTIYRQKQFQFEKMVSNLLGSDLS